MNRKRYLWRQYLAIFLPIGAGVGALIGLATGGVALWVGVGAGLGVLSAIVLARYTKPDEIP